MPAFIGFTLHRNPVPVPADVVGHRCDVELDPELTAALAVIQKLDRIGCHAFSASRMRRQAASDVLGPCYMRGVWPMASSGV